MNSIKEIVAALSAADGITILTHVHPDGDTLGCAFALKRLLEKQGKTVRVNCDSEISPRYRFLSDGRELLDDEPLDTVVCVDIATPALAGKYAPLAEKAYIVIDHHLSNPGYGKYNLVDPQAAACGEIILKLADELGGLDSRIAEDLYTAVSTDTGCFVYSNTTADTHIAAARLISAGADAAKLNKLLFRTKSHAAFELERRSLDSLEYFYDGSVTCMRLELDWIRELHACEDDIEGISSIPARIEGVKAAVTFRCVEEGRYKVSLRTNGEVNGADVCRMFGGGGHKNAAGCTMLGDYESVKSRMVAAFAGLL